MLLRIILVACFVLLSAAHAFRTAAVTAFTKDQPQTAAAVWPSHPEVLRSMAMALVGEAAGAGREPGRPTLQYLEQLAKAEPLAVEPLLVHSATAQRTSDFARAEGLLVQARSRNPRSAAARFLLADLYLRTGRILPGVAEMSSLGRMVPNGVEQVAPALASYAVTAGAAPPLKRILRVYPELEAPLLSQLAEDPRNTDLILAIARPRISAEGPSRWQEKLLRKLLEQGSYARAYAVWARLSGITQDHPPGLFNPRFEQSNALPPFNWTLESSRRGVVEPADGGLRVLYYGRDDVVLASQLMLLPAGRYRLQMTLAGPVGEGSDTGWMVTCLPANRRVLELRLRGSKGGAVAGEFAIPPGGCAAQKLELKGVAKEFPEPTDFQIAGLQLTRLGG